MQLGMGFYKNKSFGSSTITGFAANQYLIADWLFQGISGPFRASRNQWWGQVPDLIFATALPTIVGYLVLKKQAWHSTSSWVSIGSFEKSLLNLTNFWNICLNWQSLAIGQPCQKHQKNETNAINQSHISQSFIFRLNNKNSGFSVYNPLSHCALYSKVYF